MGLELRAETPEEIAVSILAEVLLVRDGGTGRAMRSDESEDSADERTSVRPTAAEAP
jgi:xanthine/CO dehydrogenase XdhC/CoxF family maturation factor